MRTIAHISDLHFGRIHQPTLAPLREFLIALKPSLLAVSGDFTQRARVEQFKEARRFLATLPQPQIVVPGNHDIPLNPWVRFTRPLERFTRFITDDLTPMFVDDEIAVLGINTTRAMITKGGRVNREQVAEICQHLGRLDKKQIRIVVTHHPFDLPEGHTDVDLVGRARMAIETFSRCGVDLFLSGHLHVTRTGSTARYRIPGYSALVIQAGTATSTRERGEHNSFNLIRIGPAEVGVEAYTWQPDAARFAIYETRHFQRSTEGWLPIAS